MKVSFEMSEYTAEADGVGVLRLLNAIRSAGLEKKTRLYQARKTLPGLVLVRTSGFSIGASGFSVELLVLVLVLES